MPVLMIAQVPGMTEEVYLGTLENLQPVLQATSGFISHAGGPHPDGGWRVVEMWDSQDVADTWFAEHVRPNLPPEVQPDRTFYEVATAFTAS
jgi:hypothetical protein